MPIDDEVLGWLNLYNICVLGTGGMGFNWPSGAWENEDLYTIKVFQILNGAISEEQTEMQEQRRLDMERHQFLQQLASNK